MAETNARRSAFSGGHLFVALAILCFSATGFVAGWQVGRRPQPSFDAAGAGISADGLLAAVTRPAAANAAAIDADPLEAFMEVYHHLQSKYVDDLTEQDRVKLAHGAVKGMLRELGDPYTRFMEPKDFGEFREENTGQFAGIGAVLQIDPQTLKVQVTRVFDDQPASKAGLLPGDYIVEVNGEATADLTLDVSVSRIRGEPGTSVHLTIERPDAAREERNNELIRRQGNDPGELRRDPTAITGEVFEVDVERAEIHVPVVESELLEGKIGWIQLTGFNEEAYVQLERQMSRLRDQGMEGLVLDLRWNPGGMLDEAIKVCSLFVKSGPVVFVQERGRPAEALAALAQYHRGPPPPLVVLVNEYSASASEILAGAVQDLGLGTIVGETTYGKGLVQTVVPLRDNSAVAITTAKYLTPHKRDINKVGIEPDVAAEWTLSNEETLEHVRDRDPRAEWDPQLMAAIRVLKEKLP